jgi:hypothetical protein
MKEFYNTPVPRVSIRSVNQHTSMVPLTEYIEYFGPFKGRLTSECNAANGPRNIAKFCSTVKLTPKIKSYGFTPWLLFLQRRLSVMGSNHPELYDNLHCAGTYCARVIRGGKSPSEHAFAAATDFGFYGRLDALGANTVRRGYLTLYEYLKFDDDGQPGAYWGGGYRRNDSMHFAVSRELFRRIIAGH